MLFRPRQKCLTYNPSIKAYDPAIDALSTLEKKDFVKYLGVLIFFFFSFKLNNNEKVLLTTMLTMKILFTINSPGKKTVHSKHHLQFLSI